MTDFLRDLSARSLGRAEVVQPRLPSIFEPVTPPSLVEVEVQIDTLLQQQPSNERTMPPVPAAQPPVSPPSLRIPSPPSATPIPEMLSSPPLTPEAPPTIAPASRLPPAIERDVFERQPIHDMPRVEVPDTPLHDLAQSPPARPESPLQPKVDRLIEVQLLRELFEPRKPLQAAVVAAPNVERAAAVTEAPPPIHPAVELVERLIAPAPTTMPTRVEQREQVSSANPEPVIHVTINRVEVRAVQSSVVPTQERSSPPPPRLTLDDYLRSRR